MIQSFAVNTERPIMIIEFQFSLKDGSISRIRQVEFEIPADPNKLEVISTTATLFRRSQ